MNFEMNLIGSALVVKVGGELDHHFAEEIRTRIDNTLVMKPVKMVLFDLNKLTFMDSSGIGMLMGRYKTISQLGGRAWIMCTNPSVSKILEMSGIYKYIKKCIDGNNIIGKDDDNE